MNHALVYLCFFLSGVSALIYQVVWVRQFGNIFGNSIYSASIVIAVFMMGLGIGSYLAGRWADRAHASDPLKPLKAYAWFEIGIALLGFLIALLLPQLEALSASVSSYEVAENGWHFLTTGSLAFRYLIAVFILLPSTVLMGGTLTLLIRYLVGNQLDQSGWKTGSLYGINTLGAAIGAWLVDFALVPVSGLFATQMLAVVINLMIAGLIISHAQRVTRAVAAAPVRVTEPQLKNAEAGIDRAQMPRLILFTSLTIFLSGFAAMGMEIIWFRVLSSIFGQYRAIFSILLTIILIGIWLGSTGGGYLQRRYGRPVTLYVFSQSVFVITAVTGLFIIDVDVVHAIAAWFAADPASSTGLGGDRMKYPLLIIGTIVSIGLPAVMMGFAYPLANAYVQRIEANVGTSSGILYFSNTMGAVAGSLVAGFYLLPELGSSMSVSLLMILALVAVIPISLSVKHMSATSAGRGLQLSAGLIALCAMVFIAGWSTQDDEAVIFKSFAKAEKIAPRIIASKEGIHETVVVVDNRDRHKGKVLYTNGHSMSSTSFGSQRYMRAFVHIPLLQLEAPTDALVICFGVGNTLHAATLHDSLQRIDVVDLSENVLSHAGYFSDTNHDAIHDERVNVYVNDGRQHLRMASDERYDLVTLEPPPIVHAGVSALYSREFYELAKQRLKPGGYITQWLPYTQTSREMTYSMIRSFIDVFPNVVMLAGSSADIILMGRKDLPNTIDPVQVKAAIEARPAVKTDLQAIDLATMTEFVGSFMAHDQEMGKLVAFGVPAVTDDYPIMEYAPLYERQQTPPFEVIDVWGVAKWCPNCVQDGKVVDALANLGVYLQVMDQMFEKGKLAAGMKLEFELDINASQQAVDAAIDQTPYLARMFGHGQTMQ